MSLITILLIAVSLSMDAFAVAVTYGLSLEKSRVRNALKIAAFFGGFQAVMPLIGWAAGLVLENFISSIDHWIAFALLVFIGCKMIYEAFKKAEDREKFNTLTISMLLLLSIATSIDAFAVGISFAFLKVAIITPVIIIGIITFLLSFAGVFIGSKLGHIFERKIEILGGLILIGIGVKILIEHSCLR